MKKLSLLLASLLLITALAACTGTSGTDSQTPGDSDGPSSSPVLPSGAGVPQLPEPSPTEGEETQYEDYIPPAADTAMELDIMMWAGDGEYHTDIGHQNYTPEELLSVNNAAAYAVAKAFNEIYPNVKINIYAKTGGIETGSEPWMQEIENFRAEHGKYPDFYCSADIVGDVKKGLCADLSIFENDPVYRTFNKSVMNMMSIEGRQFALPQYLLPWGIWVNKSLANTNNIDIPDPDWTMDEYTSFVSHHDEDGTWYGAMDAERGIIATASKGFNYNLNYREEGDPYVELDTEEFYKLLEYIPKWSEHAFRPLDLAGRAPLAFDGYGYNNFKNGYLLTLAGDPWHMRDAAHPNPAHWGAAVMADWDIYPRPSSDELGNTVGIVLDPFAVHNYYADPGVTEEEAYAKLQMAYEFAKFWCADTRSWKARAEQMYTDGDAQVSALNDSLPMVTGDAFLEQMEIWYSIAEHQRFADVEKMPGFHEILRLWQEGEIWDFSDKAFPTKYEFEGSVRDILYEYNNSWDVNVSGASYTDPNWLDQMKALLPDWNTQWNQRWEEQFEILHEALEREDFHYKKTEE